MRLARHPSGNYYLDYEDATGKHRISTQINNIVAARTWAAPFNLVEKAFIAGHLTEQAVNKLKHGRYRLKLSHLVKDWEEHIGYGSDSKIGIYTQVCVVKHWLDYVDLSDKFPNEVNEHLVNFFVNRPGNIRGYSRKTELRFIRKFCEWLWNKGYTERNSARLCKVKWNELSLELKTARPKLAFTPEEIALLLDEAEGDFWPMAIELGVHTGLRFGDIAQLEWRAIDFGGSTVRTFMDKVNRVTETFPIPRSLTDKINALPKPEVLDGAHSRFIFWRTAHTYRIPTRRAGLPKQFERLCLRAGVRPKGFHALRRMVARDKMEQTGDISRVARFLGHSSTTTTKGYL